SILPRRQRSSEGPAAAHFPQAGSEQPVLQQFEKRQIALVEARGRDRRTFEATRLNARTGEDRAHLRDGAGELLLRLADECAKGVARNRAVVVLLRRQRLDQLVAEAPRRLKVADPALVAEVRERGGLGDRLLHSAEAVDEADLMGGAAVPDPALRNLVHVSGRLVASR